ncbi:MAG: PEPxxWA-CTERM sorting domain-containing protein [Alphaproteobacteria bacterium]|nr:PEPxxWA-CTERM sorting domain-containing protein [Alphaproteobacteria bacterium]MBU1513614.1 PEPxxWA-CTERM sorting domain-containing protein [Alphaproteobacteria bacterium]MBU2094741.1 PEPxxWA-CTERM sorting domain-containing protein [Alphaproteobacteria bacterium]MBU2150190.1 PEPxxWA-CTERM sorting domain-containing protein [Alphaproteobacteria bacterium]MBU2309281.1 PEPxxWA-CTERM sorting domain-containing protein [Alphaproteobacteria bacterium]
MSSLLQKSLPALVAALAMSGTAQAAIVTVPQSSLVASTGYYTNNLGANIVTTGGGNGSNVGRLDGRNDDGFQGEVNLGFDYTLFGTTYNSLYINNNGSVSFGAGVAAYDPSGPTGQDSPIISPFFSDVDTRNPLSGVVHYQLDTAGQLVVTWDQVAAYNTRGDVFNSFQLVLRGDNFTTPEGEGQIGFFYKTMDWQASDTGANLAAVGFGDGAGNGQVLQGSTGQLNLNDAVENHHIWFDANLVVVPPGGAVPEPSTWAMMVLGLGGVGALMRRRRMAFAAA